MRTPEEKLIRRIAVAGKREPADLVVKNGTIVNVFTGATMKGDVAIADGAIVGIGRYEGMEVADAEGRYLVPGLIDGHVHIESTMLTPSEYAKVSLLHGVTTAITDPHEIANVAGTRGIDYMLNDAAGVPMDLFVMLPSSVPATPYETSGATLAASDLAPYLPHPGVLGLAEVMDYPAVRDAEPSMIGKLAASRAAHIDGHAAGIDRDGLNVYGAAGIRTDHEGISAEEAQDRLDLGFYLMIREGTVCKNLDALLPVVNERTARRCLFVTDDMLPDDLVDEGSVDHVVRLAIAKGLDPVTAIQMTTINAAECFGLRDRGAIAPGYAADFLVVGDLARLSIRDVYKNGVRVVEDGKLVERHFPDTGRDGGAALPKIRTKDVAPDDFAIPLTSPRCNVIGIVPNQIVTRHLAEDVDVENGKFRASTAKDQLKLAVIERHRATGNIGLGIVKGFKFKKGAIATTVAHDSHNIVIVGASDEEMTVAFRHLVGIGGGLVVVADGQVVAALPLPVAGLMSDQGYETVYDNVKALNEALGAIGFDEPFNPFLTLSFLTLPVVPSLKLTDMGLFEFGSYGHIPVQA